jgi:hypothetical protein
VWSIDAGSSDTGCTLPTTTLSCDFGTINPGQSRHVHISALVVGRATSSGRNDNCGQRVTNTAAVQFGGTSAQSNIATEDINCLPPTAAGRLTITKFADNNGNVVQDSGEANLAGWTFEIKNNATGAVTTATTGANGQAIVENLTFGDYTVTEVSCTAPCDIAKWLPTGYWVGAGAAVKSTTGAATITVNAGDQSITFGNRARPQLPSTSTKDETDIAPLGLLLFALIVGQLFFLVRTLLRRAQR